ncbi:unnamed protein product [Ectocarpus sp. CCAP 1310/34]|nr:unnamed protein product [Ectocarpus sp. CCAP 1310/34]
MIRMAKNLGHRDASLTWTERTAPCSRKTGCSSLDRRESSRGLLRSLIIEHDEDATAGSNNCISSFLVE